MRTVNRLDQSVRSQQENSFGNTPSLPQVIQTDAPINPGNSAGAKQTEGIFFGKQ